jgi:tetratricopeptide (TPR) repeat protein
VKKAKDYFEQAEGAAKASDWALAEEALSAGLLLNPDAVPVRYFELGTARRRLGDHAGAADAIAKAIVRRGNRPAPALWHFQRASMLAKIGDWASATDAYETAIETRTTIEKGQLPPLWYRDLALACVNGKRQDEARDAFRHWIDLDPQSPDVERQMLAASTMEYPARRTHGRFVLRHLDEIRKRADDPVPTGPDRTDLIYSFWAQSFDTAPDVVQLCHRRLLERSSREVLSLDMDSMSKLVRLPAFIEDRPHIRHAHRAGLLRLELLLRFGGSWIDADCLVMSDVGAELHKLRQPAGFFAFDKSRTTLRNWILSAAPGSYLLRMQRAALHHYWRLHNRPVDYLAFHYIWEALTILDERFGREWAASPRPTYKGVSKASLAQPCDDASFDAKLSKSFVHKLDYRRPPVVPADSLLEKILQRC